MADPGIKEPGGAVPARYIFFRSEDCFDAPVHIPYASVVRVETKIHIVIIACTLITIKFLRVIQSI